MEIILAPLQPIKKAANPSFGGQLTSTQGHSSYTQLTYLLFYEKTVGENMAGGSNNMSDENTLVPYKDLKYCVRRQFGVDILLLQDSEPRANALVLP